MMTNNSNNNSSSNSEFNAAPILLRHPSSFMIDSNMMYQQQDTTKDYHSPTSPLSPIMDDVPQRLEPEQYQYEFPPKSHLQALSIQLDQSIEDSYSFFDASSFTTTTCTTSSMGSSRVSSVVTDDFNAQEDQEFNSFLATLELEQQQQQQQQSTFSLSPPPIDDNDTIALVHDRHLSPLQLPQQAPHQMAMMSSSTRVREESYDSISTITQPIVAPASFLAPYQQEMDDDYEDEIQIPIQDQIEWHDTFGTHPSLWQNTSNDFYDSIHPHHRLSEDQDLPVIRRDSEMLLTDDSSSMMTDDFDLNSHFSSNSKVILFKLSKKTKVASPYLPKRNTNSSSVSSDEGYNDDLDFDDDKELPIESASVFLPLDEYPPAPSSLDITTLLKQQQVQIDQLTSQLQEEKAMRTAFEKAMEEMVLLMDQQQKMLYDRVEQEVTMRQVYENKMQDALLMVKPLEQKLKKETDARCELESMMSHVLGELQDIKSNQQVISSRTTTPSSRSTRTTTTTPSSRSSRTTTTPSSRSTRTITTTTATPSSRSTRTTATTHTNLKRATKVPTPRPTINKTLTTTTTEKRSLNPRSNKSSVTTISTKSSRPPTSSSRVNPTSRPTTTSRPPTMGRSRPF